MQAELQAQHQSSVAMWAVGLEGFQGCERADGESRVSCVLTLSVRLLSQVELFTISENYSKVRCILDQTYNGGRFVCVCLVLFWDLL